MRIRDDDQREELLCCIYSYILYMYMYIAAGAGVKERCAESRMTIDAAVGAGS